MGQLIKTWEKDTTPGPSPPSSAPAPHWSRPYSHTPTDDVLDSQADHRLRTHTQAPLPPQIPPEEEAPMEDVGQNDPLQLSDSTRAALDQLLSQIDQATSTVETHLTADSYAALAALPLSYPWSCLVLDLKELLPILDRYVLSCIIASHATLYTDLIIWVTNLLWLAAGATLLEGVRHVNALRMFHPFTRVSHVSSDSGTCRGLWFGVFVWLFVACLSPLVGFVLQVPDPF